MSEKNVLLNCLYLKRSTFAPDCQLVALENFQRISFTFLEIQNQIYAPNNTLMESYEPLLEYY